MLESKVENHLRKEVEAEGGEAYKFTSPGRNGVPDRLVLKPIPKEYQELIGEYIYFVECKRPKGGVVSTRQEREHKRLRALGFKVKLLKKVRK